MMLVIARVKGLAEDHLPLVLSLENRSTLGESLEEMACEFSKDPLDRSSWDLLFMHTDTSESTGVGSETARLCAGDGLLNTL